MRIIMDGKYCRGDYGITLGRYPNGGLAIKLVGDATLSVNPVAPVPAGCICIKNWGECEGIEPSLICAGLIEAKPEQYFKQGFVQIPVYRLVGKLAELSHRSVGRPAEDLEAELDRLFPNALTVDLG